MTGGCGRRGSASVRLLITICGWPSVEVACPAPLNQAGWMAPGANVAAEAHIVERDVVAAELGDHVSQAIGQRRRLGAHHGQEAPLHGVLGYLRPEPECPHRLADAASLPIVRTDGRGLLLEREQRGDQ